MNSREITNIKDKKNQGEKDIITNLNMLKIYDKYKNQEDTTHSSMPELMSRFSNDSSEESEEDPDSKSLKNEQFKAIKIKKDAIIDNKNDKKLNKHNKHSFMNEEIKSANKKGEKQAEIKRNRDFLKKLEKEENMTRLRKNLTMTELVRKKIQYKGIRKHKSKRKRIKLIRKQTK